MIHGIPVMLVEMDKSSSGKVVNGRKSGRSLLKDP